MFEDLKYNKDPFIVINDAFDMIPDLRDGKSDAVAIVSYIQDIKIFKRFKTKYLWAVHDKPVRMVLIEKWNKFCSMRNDEDYKAHRETKNSAYYDVIFTSHDND